MQAATVSYTLLLVTGNDAAAFLRSQLTVDVQQLAAGQHALAAWCDAKGRTLCTLRVMPQAGSFLLLIPTDLASAISRRLRMYVLRAAVDITDVTDAWTLTGLTTETAETTALPDADERGRADDSLRLDINTGHGPGTLIISHPETPASAPAITDTTWQLAEIDAGLPEISAATSGLFVPQMLNLHWLGALAFDKGCYPGQEVIARLQYRGRLTRRLFRLRWHGEQPQAGADVFGADGAKQGTVIRSASCDDGAGRLLAVIRVDASNQPLATSDARLELLDLPYATGDA